MTKGFSKALSLLVALALVGNASIAAASTRKSGTAPTPSMGAKKASKVSNGQSAGAAGLTTTFGQSTPSERALKDRMKVLSGAGKGTPEVVPGEMIIKYKPGVQAAEAASIRRTVQATPVRKFKNGAELVKLPAGQNVFTAAANLRRNGKVAYAEPNYVVKKSDVIPTDGLFQNLWGLKNTGEPPHPWANPGTPGIDIQASPAWDITQGSPEVVVAVLDTGIDLTHQELKLNAWQNPAEICGDLVDNDNNGMIDDCTGWDFVNWDSTHHDADEHYHGTHVAGTIAAAMDGFGVVGVAPNVKLMSLKFLGPNGSGDIADAISAIEYAVSKGVKIINNSWGTLGYSQALADVISSNPQTLFVAAAGNDSLNLDDTDPSTPVAYPAGFEFPNVLSVAAINNTGALAEFSNYGAKKVHVAAPGVDILSTVPKLPITAAAVQNDAGSYKTMFWGFGVEDMADTEAQTAIQRTLSYFGAGITTPILVVLDDESTVGDPAVYPSVQPKLQTALAGYNATFVQVNHASDAQPFTATDYPVAIWATGRGMGAYHSSLNTLSPTDMATIDTYLSQGGKLLVTGQDALMGNVYSPVFTQKFGVRYINEGDPRTGLRGVANNAYDGALYSLTSTTAENWRDMLDVIAGHPTATKALLWDGGEDDYRTTWYYLNGTSMASPHVAGVAALVASVNPDMTAVQIKDRIMTTVNPLPSLMNKTVTGGMVSAYKAVRWEADNDVPGVLYPGWGRLVQGEVDSVADLDDVYRVRLRAGEQIKVWLSGAPGTDFDLYLFNHNTPTVNDIGYLLQASETFGSEEYLEFTVTQDAEYFVDVFAYEGKGNYSLKIQWGNGPGKYEENHKAVAKDLNWSSRTDTMASGGAYTLATAANSTLSMNFYGEIVTVYGMKGVNLGMATITLDGVPVDVDLYSATTQYNVPLFTKGGLNTEVEHVVTVRAQGMRSPYGRKTATGVVVDYIDVALDDQAPAPVSGVVAYPYDSKVELGWPRTNTEPDFAGYLIYRSTNGGAFEPLTPGPLPASQLGTQASGTRAKAAGSTTAPWVWFMDTTVTNGNDYSYYVVAVDTKGNKSTPSNTVTAHPDPAPAMVSGLTATPGNAQVTLAWTPNPDSDMGGYEVQRNDGPGTGFRPLTTVPHTAGTAPITYTDTGLTNGVTYSYLVWPYDMWGVYSNSPTEIAATPDAPPAAPVVTKATMDLGGNHIYWTASTETGMRYVVKRQEPNGTWTQVYEGTWTEFHDPVTATRDFQYMLYAVNSRNVWSTETVVNILDVVGPSAPVLLQATPDVTSVTLSWANAPESDTAEYVVRMSRTGAADEFRSVSKPDFEPVTYVWSGLSAGTTYRFAIAAKDIRGNQSGDYSNELTVTTLVPDSTPPAPASALKASAGDRQVTLNWTASTTPSDVDRYEVWYGTGGTQPTNWQFLSQTPGTTHTASGLANGITYWFKIVAVDAAGNRATESNVVYAMPNANAVGAGKYENTSASVTFTRAWSTSSSTAFSGGSISLSLDGTASASLTFSGTSISWAASKTAKQGIADVYIDGVFVTTVDLYAATSIHQQVVFNRTGLPAGVHTIRIVRTGTANPSALDSYVNVDFFTVQ